MKLSAKLGSWLDRLVARLRRCAACRNRPDLMVVAAGARPPVGGTAPCPDCGFQLEVIEVLEVRFPIERRARADRRRDVWRV
jgi:hypothetical protein